MDHATTRRWRLPSPLAIQLCSLALLASFLAVAVSSALAAAPDPARSRPLWTNSVLIGSPEPPSPYLVEKVFTNATWKNPIYTAPVPGSDRLWVVQQGGEKDRLSRILSIPNKDDARDADLAFSLEGRLIYGLTFHPGFATNRFVYLFCNGPTGSGQRTNRIERLVVGRDAPHVCDPASATTIIQWPSAGHDGGDLAFGRDGMLYITSGDGSSDSDTYDSGQDVSNLLATLIRIEVDHPDPGRAYSVPRDNPFLSLPGARPEIWAYGFRNPWRMCVDEKTGDIWVGQNGQDLWETAYLVRRGDNFGWSVFEGSHPFYPNRRRGPTPIVPPTIEHSHAEFRSLTGGVVHYGAELPDLQGAYIYGDYGTGKIWGARHENGRLTWSRELVDTTLQIVGFRTDQRGRLLVVDLAGALYRLVPRPPTPPGTPFPFPARLSDTRLFQSVARLEPAPGLIPYEVNAPAWTDGALARRHIALPGSARIQYASSRGWAFPDHSVLVQTLSLPQREGDPGPERRIETRLLIREDGEWSGYSYRWNQEQTDATLVPKEGANLQLDRSDSPGQTASQAWRIPSRSECLACHSRAVGFVLGLSEPQLNRPRAGHPATNQLTHLAGLGALAGLPSDDPAKRPALVDPYDSTADLDRRARSYLHANCSGCHVEAGGGNAKMEFEFTRARDQMNLFDARPQHDTFGLPNAMLLAPGHPEQSVLVHRLSQRGRGQMPPLVIARVDERAVALMRDWIAAMKPSHAVVKAWTVADFPDLPGTLAARKPVTAAGKAAFQRLGCVQCHAIEGAGGNVGPHLDELAKRLPPVAVLESILEPSKVIADAYASHEIEWTDGETVTGRIEREDEHALYLRLGSGVESLQRIPREKIARRTRSAVSNMPAGMLDVLERDEILDLLGYLLAGSGAPAPRAEFTRLVAHWANYGHPDYLPFIREAHPDVAQVGFYGAHFWSLVHTPEFGGYPAHFPVRGLAEASDWFANLNRQLHEAGTKVVGHFNVEFLVGDPESPTGPRGFFHFYRNLWDERVLGPKPVADPLQLLERRKDGTPIVDHNYSIGGMKEYWACLRNPAWQTVLRAWVKRGIDLGLDGFIANYFYRHDCTCEHCDRAFRSYLRGRFNSEQLADRLGIRDLDRHEFHEIVSWHDPAKSTPLRREMLRFSQLSNKQVFDEVFVRYGRSLRPDLLVAQWNHLGNLSAISGDERCLLPAESWGRDEDYLWYSLGDSANSTDLARRLLGEGTLQARYIRGAFDDKPFTLGKYEATRIRVAIAELAANGGAPMGFYTDFTQPAAREVIVRYYRFLARHDALFRGNHPVAEAVLPFPRRAIHDGNLAPLEHFRRLGTALLDDHVLFDVLPDDLAAAETNAARARRIDAFSDLEKLPQRSRFTAPATVRVSLSRPANSEREWDLHLVNYDRTEPARTPEGHPSPGGGIHDEQPTPAPAIPVDLALPHGPKPAAVDFITPERDDTVPLPFTVEKDRLRFTTPGFLVYGMARVRFE